MTQAALLERPLATVQITRSGVSAIMSAPEWDGLVAEYHAESKIEGLPPPNAKLATYRQLENTGMLEAVGARKDGALIGFLFVLTPVLPHFSALVATAESFFVAAAHRKGGAGLRLLRMAEDIAAEKGSPGLLISAPVTGRLTEILPRRGYVETSRVFFKPVSHG